MKSAARSVLAAVVGSAVLAGCGGESQAPADEIGQVSHALAYLYPGQMTFTGLSSGAVIEKVECGHTTGFAKSSDGKRWGWGANNYGQAGTSTFPIATLTPTQLRTTLSSVVDFRGGEGFYSAGLTSTGSILTIGYNSNGQLGNGTTTNSTSTPVTALTSATAVAAGTTHVLALKSDGTLWAWGTNASGELGDGTFTSPRLSPVQVTGLTGVTITAIAAGERVSYALDSSGNVWAWGHLVDSSFVSVNVPQQVTGLSSVVAIAAREFHALALDSSGSVSHIGLGSTVTAVSGLPTIKAVAVGQTHYLAAGVNGSLWSWGSNVSGELGNGTTTASTSPVQVLRSSTPGDYLTGVDAVAAGDETSFALLSNGTLWSWGNDSSGRIGR